MSVITGTSANDTLTGTTGVDTISGLDGNDSLFGDAGNDMLDGGNGNDTLDGGAGNNTLQGGSGDDVYILHAGGGASIPEAAGGGIDTIYTDSTFITLGGTGITNVENIIYNGTGNSSINGSDYNNFLQGGSGNDVINSGWGSDTVFGLDGNDTISSVTDATPGYFDGGNGFDVFQVTGSAGPLSLVTQATTGAYDSGDFFIHFEGLIGGTGSDTFTGDAGNNLLDGGSGGNDLLEGGAGADTITGISFTASYAHSPSAVNINYLTGAASGGDAQGDVITEKGASQPIIIGSDFADTFTASNAKYAVFEGGKGDDTYIIQSLSRPVEQPGEGIDTIQMSSSVYTLPDNIENLIFTNSVASSGTGNASNNLIVAPAGVYTNDSLVGLAGDDTLIGGLGADTMVGGSGDDTYYVDALVDVTTETAGNGTDTIIVVNFDSLRTDYSYSLASVPNIENLTLVGISAPTGIGNAANNVMTGNSGANTLFGVDGNDTLDGGAGADSLSGDLGNDLYYVDNAGDQVIEAAGAGSDTVSASVSFTLSDNIENLVLTGSAASGTGNALNNVITGDAGANTLDGGLGADTLIGGAGDDTYLVDNAGDTATESAGGGTDTVIASIDQALSANVENLTLTGSASTGVGNSLDNLLIGDAGANSLFGAAGNDTLDGGAGADTLDGGAGNDLFFVDDPGDQVVEGAGGGIDTVSASIDYSLGANLENLALTGGAVAGTGNGLDNVITGTAGANSLYGGDGNDTLIGAGGDDALTGGNGADSLDGGAGADTLAGGAGDDSYVVDNAGDVVTEAPGDGVDTVTASVDHALPDNVENLTLTGSAVSGTGNALDNIIIGDAGDNTLDGGAGADTLIGGAGNDTYMVDNADDVVTEGAGAGVDTVLASVDYSLDAYVENLTLTGAAVSGTGNSLSNVINGDAGDNSLDGGAGADTLVGGAGDDTYAVDNVGDVVTEGVGAGIDTVTSSVSYTLSANVENLTLTGSAVAGTGNDLNNLITGDSGANTLDGGLGADTLVGGGGGDTYVVDNLDDQVVEGPGAGIDTVLSSADHALSANVENLVLTGSANLAGTGNGLDNLITGNAGNNVLDGGDGADTLLGGGGADLLTGGAGDDSLDGGTGADTLTGGAGDDSYAVDNPGDVITEAPGDGVDTVTASVDYALPDNVENLTLTGSAVSGTGNALNNMIIGDAGDNTLDGEAGADTLIGGAGDDTYVVDDPGDVVTEAAGAGVDTVLASVDHTLSANVENLSLTGSGDISGTGNGLDNLITGNAGANSLDGGAGNDTLTGGLGADSLSGGGGANLFVYGDVAESPAAGADLITDFVSGTDRINLSGIDVDPVTSGHQGFSWIGTSAFSAAGQLRYEVIGGVTTVEGDVDGDGVADLVIRLTGAPTLSGSDFVT
jgi:Ca2+-binding RTX toxin-like protein